MLIILMCGIGGVFIKQNGDNKCIFQYIYKTLYLLQSRGYDSVGLCTMSDYTFHISKYSVEDHRKYIFDLLKYDEEHHSGNVAIGHTRWASLGKKTDVNAHPHVSNSGTISVVHNGHIDNHNELRYFLQCHGYKFNGSTDSEIIPNYLEYLEDVSRKSFLECIQILQTKLEGSWSCLVVNKKYPDTLFFFKNKMPLFISKGIADKHVIVSDPSVFIEPMKEYYYLFDNSYGMIDNHNFYVTNYQCIPFNHQIIDDININHVWTLQNLDNIYETILNTRHEYIYRNSILMKVFRYIPNTCHIELPCLEPYKSVFLKARYLVLVGTGTSKSACMFSKIFLEKMEIFDNIFVLDACEYSMYDIPRENYIVFFVSQSSENRYIEMFYENLIHLDSDACAFGIFNNQLGGITSKLKANIMLNAGKDFAHSFVKSFVAQHITLHVLGVWVKSLKCETNDTYLNHIYTDYEQKITNIIKNQHVFSNIAKEMIPHIEGSKTRTIYFFGKNEMYPIALECSQKIRDITHYMSVGLSFNEYKNGYINCIDKMCPVILLVDKNKNYKETRNIIQELSIIRSNIYIFTNEMSLIFYENMIDPSHVYQVDDCLGLGLIYLVMNMYLAYYIAFHLKINPDRPKVCCH